MKKNAKQRNETSERENLKQLETSESRNRNTPSDKNKQRK